MKPPIFLLFLGNPADGASAAALTLAQRAVLWPLNYREPVYGLATAVFGLTGAQLASVANNQPQQVIPEWGLTPAQIVDSYEAKISEIHVDAWSQPYCQEVAKILAHAESTDPAARVDAGNAVCQITGCDRKIAGDWLREPRFAVYDVRTVAGVRAVRAALPDAVVHVVLVTRDADAMPAWMAELPGDTWTPGRFHTVHNTDDGMQFSRALDALLVAVGLAPPSPLAS